MVSALASDMSEMLCGRRLRWRGRRHRQSIDMVHQGVRVPAWALCTAVVDLRVGKLVVGRQWLL
jgi:hypothetical protein